MKRRKPMRRNVPLKGTWGALKRKRLRPLSPKRQRELRIYSAQRQAFLEEHPYCQAWLTLHIIPLGFTMQDAESLCLNGMLQCPLATEIHHKKKRGRYYLDTSTWCAISKQMHRWVHGYPALAREKGLLA